MGNDTCCDDTRCTRNNYCMPTSPRNSSTTAARVSAAFCCATRTQLCLSWIDRLARWRGTLRGQLVVSVLCGCPNRGCEPVPSYGRRPGCAPSQIPGASAGADRSMLRCGLESAPPRMVWTSTCGATSPKYGKQMSQESTRGGTASQRPSSHAAAPPKYSPKAPAAAWRLPPPSARWRCPFSTTPEP